MIYGKLVSDSLKLLNKDIINNPGFKEQAIKKLSKVPDHALQIYLLQLVQALRYEFDLESDEMEIDHVVIGTLGKFLIERAIKNPIFASFFHWYIFSEIQISKKLQRTDEFFHLVYETFLDKLVENSKKDNISREIVKSLRLQGEFITQILALLHSLSDVPRAEKTRKLKKYLIDISITEPIPLPLRPSKKVLSVNRQTAKIFPSANAPAILDLLVENKQGKESTYRMMFKSEDLRQDQLVITMIRMIDRMLKEENMDFYLTCYNIITTSDNEGFLEFVPNAWSISKIIQEYGDITAFFKENSSTGIIESMVDRLIKSCAANTMIMYILGVGDRHSDNIMVKPTGEMFHIDFGYMFGRDPKPIKQDFSVTRELIEGMGGRKSNGYFKFRNYCWKVFKLFRENYFLIINMISLMADANIPDLSVNQDIRSVMINIKNRFQFRLSDEDAEMWLYKLINKNADALGPVFMDFLHRKFNDTG